MRAAAILLSLILVAAPALASPIGFIVTPLASDQSDPHLTNPWGLASSPTSPFWIGANHSGLAVLYSGAGVQNALAVTIPGDGSVTGVVFNAAFASSFNGDPFLFASEDGTVSGWRGALGTSAETLQTADPDNVYKGMTMASTGGHEYAYLADFRAGEIDVMRGDALAPNLTGHFLDPSLPAGYAPFDIQNLNGLLYVTYALQDASGRDDQSGAGHGFVDVFDLNGNLIRRLVSNGVLNSPWGLAIAPAGFGDVGGSLLVGNFGDGHINAFDPATGAFIETLLGTNNQPLTIDGLWGLRFGNAGNNGTPLDLYFTAGPNSEAGGLFGVINATGQSTPPGVVPEPATIALVGGGLLAALRRRGRVTS
ncbi:MAG TPA: TIGR03118 family protein [Vicinamibacterales bacterium]|nr:TIGR03118 family protein [Vicinamibacterales bacterium]